MGTFKAFAMCIATVLACFATVTVTVFFMALCWKLGVAGADAVMGLMAVM